LPHWILATFLLCLACSSRRIAREVGVHIRTSYRWCWWLRNAALSYEMQRQVEGIVEADDLYHTAGQKGQAKQGGKKSLGRRAGIEPLIGHAKQGGQLRQSRMKTDETTLAAGYGAIGGFNLRQLIRHLLGKDIKPMG
jgi:hypothetical protein